MSGFYELRFADDSNNTLTMLDTTLGFFATRVANGIGRLEMRLPWTFDDSFLARDRMIHVLRRPAGGTLGLFRTYFLRRWKFVQDSSGEYIWLYAVDPNELLMRRIVAAYAGSAEASKAGFADDMAKEIVTESLSDSVGPTPDEGTRVWDNFSVAGDVGAGAEINDSFAFNPVASNAGGGVLVDLMNASKIAGIDLYFDVAVLSYEESDIQFEFRTYVNQPGRDLSDRVTFSAADSNLTDIVLDFDYSEEITAVYAGGQGEGPARTIKQEYDAARYAASRYNRREAFIDARNRKAEDDVIEAARAALRAGEPKVRFSGTPKDTAGTRYGIHWNWGDRVKAKHRKYEFTPLIRSIGLGLDANGVESIQSQLKVDENV